MIEILGIPFGSIAQIITAFSSVGLLALIGTLVIGYWKRGVDLKKLSDEAEFNLMTHLKTELEKVYARQRECEEREENGRKEINQLRKRVGKLEDELAGVYRTFVANSADKVIELRDNFPPHVVEMAERTLAAQRKGR